MAPGPRPTQGIDISNVPRGESHLHRPTMDFRAMYRQERAAKRLAAKSASATATTAVRIAPTLSAKSTVPLVRNSNINVHRAPPLPHLTLPARPQLALHDFAVGSVADVFYVPDFITAAEEAQMLERCYWDNSAWVRLKCRNLQCFGRSVHPEQRPHSTMPQWLQETGSIIAAAATGVFPGGHCPNHVLVNEYPVGSGIMAHQDGPQYEPLVATLSLGSPCLLSFYKHVPASAPTGTPRGVAAQAVALMPRSLVIFRQDAYSDYLHGIADVASEVVSEPSVVNMAAAKLAQGSVLIRGTPPRISLTFRNARYLAPSSEDENIG